jgi:hypothetical protein
MPWFGKRKEEAARRAARDEFVEAYRAAMARLGVTAQSWGVTAVKEATMILWMKEKGEGPPPDAYEVVGVQLAGHEVRFDSVRVQYAQIPAADRPALLDFHLKALLETERDGKPGARPLEGVRDRLLPVVRGPMPVEENAPPSLALAEGLVHVYLVVDSEHTMSYVSDDDLATWGKSFGDVLTLAVENLRRRSPPSAWTTVDGAPGVLFYHTGDSYDASRALLLRDLVQPWPEEGAFVSVPSRDLLVCVPLRDLGAIRQLGPMAAFSRDRSREEAYAICERTFWFDGRAWEPVSIEFEKKGPRIAPSERLTHALVRLGGAGAAKPREG